MPLADAESPPYLNEIEWQTAQDPQRMLYFLCYHWRQNLPRWLRPAKTSGRKLRLLACACARLHPELDDAKLRELELAERFADGLATKAALKAAMSPHGQLRFFNTLPAIWPYAYDAAYHGAAGLPADTLLPLLRDIFGNPYRPVKADPRWLTRDVLSLARAIYAERAFHRLPELASTLEQAGCAHAGILTHCRCDAAHVRGCWVVDLLLSRK